MLPSPQPSRGILPCCPGPRPPPLGQRPSPCPPHCPAPQPTAPLLLTTAQRFRSTVKLCGVGAWIGVDAVQASGPQRPQQQLVRQLSSGGTNEPDLPPT